MLTTNGGGSIVTVKIVVALLLGDAESYALIVIDPVSMAVGVPAMTPFVVSNVNPAGSVPETSCQTHAPEPPRQVNACMYRSLRRPFGRAVGVMRSGGSAAVDRLSPESAIAAAALIGSTFAPRSAPSVPMFLYGLVASRR